MGVLANSSYESQHFRELDLAGESVSGIEFEDCRFSQCAFAGTHFERCNFVDCEFENCDLNLADLGYSKLSDVSFRSCKLRGVDWARVSWPRVLFAAPLQFYECLLDDSSFFGLDLPELIAEDCRLCSVDFREANLSSASFRGSDLSGAQFSKSVLEKADFCAAQNYYIDIFNSPMRGAKFSRYEALVLLDSLDIELSD